MRKAIIAAIVASALFAVGAFAASFSVNSEDVASGSDDVERCADLVDIDFNTSYEDGADAGRSDWEVASVDVAFYDYIDETTDFSVSAGCAAYDLTLILEDEDGGEITDLTGTWAWNTTATPPNTVATFTYDSGPLASTVGHAAILADGITLFEDSDSLKP